MTADGEIFMDMAIAGAIGHWCPKADRSGLYLEAQRAVNANLELEKEFKSSQFMIKWAAGLLKLIRVTNPEVSWAPITVDGIDVAQDGMPGFRVMPKV